MEPFNLLIVGLSFLMSFAAIMITRAGPKHEHASPGTHVWLPTLAGYRIGYRTPANAFEPALVIYHRSCGTYVPTDGIDLDVLVGDFILEHAKDCSHGQHTVRVAA